MKFNIASYLPRRAKEMPFSPALFVPEDRNALGTRKYSHLTFAQLEVLSNQYANHFTTNGLKRGDRVLMMVRQGLELIGITYALFKIGAVPVLIDPGMGRQSFLSCIEDCKPDAMVGIPQAHIARTIFASKFKSVKRFFTTETKWYTRAIGLESATTLSSIFETADTDRDDLAAILFTSGSTGPPKGVHYTHGIFDGQTEAIQRMYDIQPGDVAVPGFPLFALFSVAMGMACCIPDMDPAAPAQVDPNNLVEVINDFGASMAFGSPAIWNVLIAHCEKENIELPSMKKLLTFGAAIQPKLMERCEAVMPNVVVHTPYGATESLPVASISSTEVLRETAEASRNGAGICVGLPNDQIELRIVNITDDAIVNWSDTTELGPNNVGEICVKGPVVTPAYDNKPEHNRMSKIQDGDGFWHRMGDVGYLDESGRLWFCGRKSHRVETATGPMYTVKCEAIFNAHPDVYRTALVGMGEKGAQIPAMIIEPEPGKFPDGSRKAAFIDELRAIAQSKESTKSIETFAFERSFPVDKRHNAKIHRLELGENLSKQLDSAK